MAAPRDEMRRASAFEEALRDRCAERIEPYSRGRALFNDSLPLVWELNMVRVERADGASAADLVDEADRIQRAAGLAHRRIVVLDEAAGEGLEAEFRELGWQADRSLYMAHRREPERPPSRIAVAEVAREELEPLRERLIRERPLGKDDEVVRQLIASGNLIARAARARHFGVFVDGAPACAADLYSDGTVAQIEDVATAAEHRGHGFATAVVLRALDEAIEAGHELIFLTADENDWPKELYAKLGFEPIGRKFAFTKPPAAPRSEKSLT